MPRLILPWVERDRKARGSFIQHYLKKTVLKSLLYNQNQEFSQFSKMCWALKYHDSPKYSSQATLRRACNLSNSPRSIFRIFKMSRHSVKKWVSQGRLPGVRKSSF